MIVVPSIILTLPQYHEAQLYGYMRFKNALEEDRKTINGISKDGLDAIHSDLIGAMGERSYAKWKDKPWIMAFIQGDLRNGNFRKPSDFGPVDVKTKKEGGFYLPLQKGDPEDRCYVLATARLDSLRVSFNGWIWGYDAKRKEFYGDPFGKGRPCFAIHEDALNHSWDKFPF